MANKRIGKSSKQVKSRHRKIRAQKPISKRVCRDCGEFFMAKRNGRCEACRIVAAYASDRKSSIRGSAKARAARRAYAREHQRICPVCRTRFAAFGKRKFCSKSCYRKKQYRTLVSNGRSKLNAAARLAYRRRRPISLVACIVCHRRFHATGTRLLCSEACRLVRDRQRAAINRARDPEKWRDWNRAYKVRNRVRYLKNQRIQREKHREHRAAYSREYRRRPEVKRREWLRNHARTEQWRRENVGERLCDYCGEKFTTRDGSKACSPECKRERRNRIDRQRYRIHRTTLLNKMRVRYILGLNKTRAAYKKKRKEKAFTDDFVKLSDILRSRLKGDSENGS